MMLEFSHLQEPVPPQCPHAPFPQSSQQEIATLGLPHGWWMLEAFWQTVAGPRTGSSKSKYQPLLGDPGRRRCVCPRHRRLPALSQKATTSTWRFLTSRNVFSQAPLPSSLLNVSEDFTARPWRSPPTLVWRQRDLLGEPSQPEAASSFSNWS